MTDEIFRPWNNALVRISYAAERGVGVRLSAEECASAVLDIGDWGCVVEGRKRTRRERATTTKETTE